MKRDGGTRSGTFHGEMDRCRETGVGLWFSVVSPNVTGKTKERIAQSKRACASTLAIDD